jgi:F420-non-reducing hydrogenase iron-sulfur subunit
LKQQGGYSIETRVAIIPCKWHPLTAMENAAKDGFTCDADVTVIPVKCTGLVKVSFLLKLFAKGFGGVLVLGCEEGDCHYYNGSERCGEIVRETQEILEISGIPKRYLGFHLISDTQGKEYTRVLGNFLKQFDKQAKRRRRVAQGSRR